jgi:hypothetical protein
MRGSRALTAPTGHVSDIAAFIAEVEDRLADYVADCQVSGLAGDPGGRDGATGG